MLLLSVYYLANVYDETTRRIELLAAGGQMNFENDCGSVSNGVWANTTAHRRRSPPPPRRRRRTCRAMNTVRSLRTETMAFFQV